MNYISTKIMSRHYNLIICYIELSLQFSRFKKKN